MSEFYGTTAPDSYMQESNIGGKREWDCVN